ncbi:rod shape-determining protein RodA [Anoxybacter fermentans]|uniref:Peptidoglycan glycosyltransferase RodA n=1 Tax=Anoxybacter fermentans TaxID=1323375 RepID=A0A3Q9HTG1_9FIRM|nr:rod shape-determining protein RodA [Anoxybacter fermentans]
MDFNRKLLRNIDLSVLLLTLLLIGVGLIAITSATNFGLQGSYSITFLRTQITATILGLLMIIGVMLIDYRWLKEYAGFIYFGTLVVLGITLVLGRTVSGSKSWIFFGPVRFQPSELAKLAIIIVLAAFIADREDEMKYLFGMLKACMLTAFPVLLILAQNDLGTALVFIGILIGMLYVGGGNAKLITIVLVVSVTCVMILVILSIHFDFNLPLLKSYQLKRLQVLIDPYLDPFGYGYNIIQSEIAIGSGRMWGKGLFKGTQNKLQFLPEKHTDFIFPVIGEEFGFIGAIIVLCLYLALLLRSLVIAREARDSFGTLVVVGIIAMWVFHILENVGMTMGIMPITGIPLPFLSYGGSSMVTNMIAVGMIMNIRMRKHKILF